MFDVLVAEGADVLILAVKFDSLGILNPCINGDGDLLEARLLTADEAPDALVLTVCPRALVTAVELLVDALDAKVIDDMVDTTATPNNGFIAGKLVVTPLSDLR